MQDTQTITLSEDLFSDHPNNQNGWSQDYAELIIRTALKEMSHPVNPDEVKFTLYTSQALVQDNPHSEVCFVETDQPGFFFVMRDMMNSINVVYNRWD
ncbi:hypothetical protein [Aureitalea marina]|uniref:Uncharacterized protein n=1 Tax=Aureitalea marina TaxID=930804 RepID=A0A2S7KR46_9FLAO|nr:hypothetical protein [Aureitalea marina]PQB05096.1 hypothetical protein BST85_09470 [Aureitalea marina]